MFEIHTTSKLVREHYNKVEPMCKKAIDDLKGSDIFTSNQEEIKGLSTNGIRCANEQFKEFLTWLERDDYKYLNRIISAKPNILLDIYVHISNNFNFEICEETGTEKVFTEKGIIGKSVRENLKKIFNYKRFRDTYGYELAKNLNVRICPYCNRQFTFTVLNESKIQDGRREEVVRPEFDHYLSQEKYPIFALSFYNLIPSCHICNSNIKGLRELDIKKHYHPYIIEDKNFKFYYDRADSENSNVRTTIKIDYRNIPKAKATCEFFYLDIIYGAHNDVSDKLWKIYDEYPPDRIKRISDILSDNGDKLSMHQLLDMIFSEYKVEDSNKEILGKLRSDLYEQMKENYK